MGEAFCTGFLDRRVSVWEAQAQRHADAEAAQATSEISLASRQRIQQEALQSRRLHLLETKRLEQQRQLLQQQEIHPSHVQATLQALKEQHAPPPEPRSERLPPATPEDDPEDRMIVHLNVRKLRGDDE